MSDNDSEPALVRYGAGTDDSTRDVNLDVRGTVGPDHLGQETVTVDGHPSDRPGVRSRIPEKYGNDHPDVRRMDTGEELPVLLSSSMDADPCEGVQGSYSTITEGTCARCGYDRLRRTVHTLAGETKETCNACGAVQNHRKEDGYSMPMTGEERASREREAGERVAELSSLTLVDLETTTGAGPYMALVGSRDITRISKDDLGQLAAAYLGHEGRDGVEALARYLSPETKVAIALTLTEGGVDLGGDDLD